MTAYSVGGTSVTFFAIDTSFSDKGGPLEEITIGFLIDNPTDWGAMFSLRSWMVTQRPIPGGNNVYVDIGGGAGVGSLSIDNLDSHQAVMIALSRNQIDGGLRSSGTATWIITG